MTLRRLIWKIPARPLLGAVGLVILVAYFVQGLLACRLPGRWFVLALGASLVLLAVAILRAAWCAATLQLPPSLRAVGHHADRFVLLVVVNLIIVSALSPILRIAAAVPNSYSITHGAMAVGGGLSADVLLLIFVAGVVLLGWVLLLLVLRATLGRLGLIRALARGMDWLVVAVLVLFCVGSMGMLINVELGDRRSTPVRAEVAAINGVELPLGLGQVAWVELRNYPAPGLTEQIVLVRQRDEIWPQAATPGLPVVVHTVTGLFGVKWVQAIKIDEVANSLRTLAAVPTATAFRKWIMHTFKQEQKWAELRTHAEAHHRAYPNDREYLLAVVRDLERAGQAAEAAALKAAMQK